MSDHLLLKAALRQPVERTPVWVMRQAGRILKEYREVRASVSGFKELVQTPELATEVTLQPVDLLGVDAAIIFSDILEVPEAMGLPYHIEERKGPVFEKTIQGPADIDNLVDLTPENVDHVCQAIRMVKSELNGRVPVIGFAGAPWTIFCYMIEGGGSKTFSGPRKLLFTDPDMAHRLLDKITEATIKYLKLQIEAGAEIVQVFDSWAGVLYREMYQEFAIKYISKICDAITEVPVIVFAKGAYGSVSKLNELNCDVLGLDWQLHVGRFKNITGDGKALQGNLDPCILYASKDVIKDKAEKMLRLFGRTGHIANLGHGVYPDTNPDHVKYFIDVVKEFDWSKE